MRKIIDYFENLELKELIMLYALILMIAGVVVYYINYPAHKKLKDLELKRKSLLITLKENNLKLLRAKVKVLKNKLKELDKKNISLSEDLKYLTIRLRLSKKVFLDDKKFYSILEEILTFDNFYNINANYSLSQEVKDLKIYKLKADGSFLPKDYKNFLGYLITLENIDKIKSLEKFRLTKAFDKDKNQSVINFEILYNFWSVK